MPAIDEYMDRAREAHGLTSDRKLAYAMGLNQASVNHWRRQRAWPADDTMIALAELAGMDKQQALIDLNIWRAADPATRAHYASIAKMLRAAAAAIFLAASILMYAPNVNAAGTGQQVSRSVYIMENPMQRVRRRRRRRNGARRRLDRLADWIVLDALAPAPAA